MQQTFTRTSLRTAAGGLSLVLTLGPCLAAAASIHSQECEWTLTAVRAAMGDGDPLDRVLAARWSRCRAHEVDWPKWRPLIAAERAGDLGALTRRSLKVRNAPSADIADVIAPIASPCSAHVASAAADFGVDERLLAAVIWRESRGKRRAGAGAKHIGCGQLGPGIRRLARDESLWAEPRRRWAKPKAPRIDALDARQNVRAAAWFLAWLRRRYASAGSSGSTVLAVAAYNRGASAVRIGELCEQTKRNRPYVASVLTRAFGALWVREHLDCWQRARVANPAGRAVDLVRMESLLPFLRVRRPRHTWLRRPFAERVVRCVQGARSRYAGEVATLLVTDGNGWPRIDPAGPRFKRHKSHRAARDLDLGFLLRSPADPRSLTVPGRRLHAPAQVAFMACLAPTASHFFVDRGLIGKLARVAQEHLDPAAAGRLRTLMSHEPGHRDHLHVRFRDRGRAQDVATSVR